MLEGSRVKFLLKNNELILVPISEVNNKKTIGIIGGMGPEATADIYLKIIKLYQERFGAKLDRDYPRILIDSIPIPDVINNFENKEKTLSILEKSAKNLESSGADFIIVACNTVSLLLPYLENEVSIPIINIVEEVKNKILEKDYKKVGLLSTSNTIKSGVYKSLLEKFGIETINPTQESQSKINEIILNIMSGRKLKSDKNKIIKIIKELISQGTEAIILGCTELPLIMENYDGVELFNTNQILAEIAAEKSLKNGQGGVKASTEVCETSRLGSIPNSGPKGENMNEYNPQNEINIVLKKLLTGVISKKQYDRIAQIYKPIQD